MAARRLKRLGKARECCNMINFIRESSDYISNKTVGS